MSIELNENQQKTYNSTLKLCCEIESAMAATVEPTDPSGISAQLENLRPYLANCSTMMSNATAIYNWAKGEVANLIMVNEKLSNCKQTILLHFISGQLAKYSGIYVRCESIEKNLRKSIEGLVSLLSYQKMLVTQNISGN